MKYLLKFITKNVISGIALDVIKNENSKNNLKIWKRLSKIQYFYHTIFMVLQKYQWKNGNSVVDKLKLALVKKISIIII